MSSSPSKPICASSAACSTATTAICGSATRVRLAFEDIAPGIAVPAFALETAMTGRFTASKQVAIVGYAQSRIERHAAAVAGRARRGHGSARHRRRRAARRPDRRLRDRQPASRRAGPTPSKTASASCRPNWLAEHLGVNPRLRRRLPGIRPDPRLGRDGGQRDRQRAPPTTWSLHRALHNPPGSYHGNPMTRGSRLAAVDRAAGATSVRWP